MQGFSRKEKATLRRLRWKARGQGEEAATISLADLGFYRHCDLYGKPRSYEVPQRRWPTVAKCRLTFRLPIPRLVAALSRP